jgi:GNAT superfamily N-acetyltransferase
MDPSDDPPPLPPDAGPDEPDPGVRVRPTRPADVPAIVAMSRSIYPRRASWREWELESHLKVFPEGQLVALEEESDRILGMAASLTLSWDDYDVRGSWNEFTAGGMFTNHDPGGRTLYGAEVMVDPDAQGRGIGSLLYEARRELAQRLGLLRIRAGARLSGYHLHADRMSPAEYVARVIRGEIADPALSFQLKQGFEVLGVVRDYLPDDPESLGHAALIEWLNPDLAAPEDYAARGRFLQHGPEPPD